MPRPPFRAARSPGPASAVVLALAGLACGDQVVGTFDPSRGDDDALATSTLDASATATGGTVAMTAGTLDGGSDAPAPPELCDGVDNDLDGLVDEVAPGLTECDGCRLLQGAGQAWWVCDEQKTWDTARVRCEGLGATVAVVPSAVAQTFLHEAVGEGWHWLGARRAADGSAWAWLDGTPWDYANWGTTQPDDIAPGQDCLRLTFGIVGDGWFDGAWDDFFCDDPHPYMCSATHAP